MDFRVTRSEKDRKEIQPLEMNGGKHMVMLSGLTNAPAAVQTLYAVQYGNIETVNLHTYRFF